MPTKKMEKLKKKRKEKRAENQENATIASSGSSSGTAQTSDHASAAAQIASNDAKNVDNQFIVPASIIQKEGFFCTTQDGVAILLNDITPANILGLFTEGLKTCIGIFVFGSKGMALIHDTGMLKLENIERIFNAVGDIQACIIAYNPTFDEPRFGSTHQDKINRIMPILKKFRVDNTYKTVKTFCGQAWAVKGVKIVNTDPLATAGIQPLHKVVRHWINSTNNFFQKPNQPIEPDIQLEGANLYDVPQLLKSPEVIQNELKFHVVNSARVLGNAEAGKANVDRMLNIHRIFWTELNLDSKENYPNIAVRKKEFLKFGLREMDELEAWLRKQDERRAERKATRRYSHTNTNATAIALTSNAPWSEADGKQTHNTSQSHSMPKVISLEKMNELIKKVQSNLCTSNNIVNRIEYPYYYAHTSVPESLAQFKKTLEIYRKRCSDLITEVDKQALFKDFLSPVADFNNLSNGSFFHSFVLHLIISGFRIGDCGECSTQLAIELANAGYGNLAFVSIKFTKAKEGMENYHQFVVANLMKAPACQADEKTSVEQFFSSLPRDAIIGDAFLGLCFSPHHIAETFKSYINAYGGSAVVVNFRHFYNLSNRSFNGYIEVASQIKSMLETKKLLPALDKFSALDSKKIGAKKETLTLPISSSKSRDYLSRLDNILGYAAGKKIVKIDEKAATISFPSFWLRQLHDDAIKELASELEVASSMLKLS